MSAVGWIGAAAELLGSALDIFDGDRKREAELLLKQADNAQAQVMAQLEVNKAEAAHESLFVAGWRPAIGWGVRAGHLFRFRAASRHGLAFRLVPGRAGVSFPHIRQSVGAHGGHAGPLRPENL